MFGLRCAARAAHILTPLALVIAALLACKSDKEEQPLPDVAEAGEPEQPEVPAQAEAVDAGQDQADADAAEDEDEAKPARPVWRPRDAGTEAAGPQDAGQATSDAGAAVDAGSAVACAKRCQKKLKRCQSNERAGRRRDGAPSCAQNLINCMAGCPR